MQQLKKENGFTLVELLAVLVILSFLSIIVFGVFLNGVNYTKTAKNTVLLQQEVNFIITSITTFHESYPSYEIVLDTNPNANSIKLIGKDDTGSIVKTMNLSNADYQYSLYDHEGELPTALTNNTLRNSANPFFIQIVIQNKKNIEEKYEVKTIISRL